MLRRHDPLVRFDRWVTPPIAHSPLQVWESMYAPWSQFIVLEPSLLISIASIIHARVCFENKNNKDIMNVIDIESNCVESLLHTKWEILKTMPKVPISRYRGK